MTETENIRVINIQIYRNIMPIEKFAEKILFARRIPKRFVIIYRRHIPPKFALQKTSRDDRIKVIADHHALHRIWIGKWLKGKGNLRAVRNVGIAQDGQDISHHYTL